MEENQWMADFYACNASRFDLVCSHWGEPLFRYFRRYGCSSHDAEDLTQDTLMRVFLTKSNGNWFDPERGQFNPWIWTIAYRTLVTWARRPQPETTPFDDGHEPATPEPPPNGLPEDLEECGRRVLNKQEWTFIQLWEYGFGDMKQTEIAKVLGVGNARVAAIKERALAKLEDCMRQKGYA